MSLLLLVVRVLLLFGSWPLYTHAGPYAGGGWGLIILVIILVLLFHGGHF